LPAFWSQVAPAGIPTKVALFSKKKRNVEKNDPHIRLPAAFPGSGWGKLGGENGLDSRAFGGFLVRSKFAVFWQTGRNLDVFSTRTEKGGFTGFSVFDRIILIGNGAQFGLIFLQNTYPRILGVSDEG
jgi:hypothetical protein